MLFLQYFVGKVFRLPSTFCSLNFNQHLYGNSQKIKEDLKIIILSRVEIVRFLNSEVFHKIQDDFYSICQLLQNL